MSQKIHPWKEFSEKPTFYTYEERGSGIVHKILWIILLLFMCLGSYGLLALAGG